MNLLLFGFQGAGKTHFGTLLSQTYSLPFFDTDTLLSTLDPQKRTPRQLYLELGEASFRALEKKAIFSLKHQTHAIIALGGGAVLDPENVQFLHTIGTFIYLKHNAQTVEKRFLKPPFPAFIDPQDPKASIQKLIATRIPLYETIPAKVLDLEILSSPLAPLSSLVKEICYGL